MIIAVIVIFIIQDNSGMGMPVKYAQIAFLVIMGNHVMSHNQQPAENDQRGFYPDSFPQFLKFPAKVVILRNWEVI